MIFLYDVIYFVFAVLYLPYLVLRKKWHNEYWTRFGIFTLQVKEVLAKKDNIWVHAVSVGEVLAVKRLIDNIKLTFPLHQIVLSTVTKTGYTVAQKTFPQDIVIYCPFDFSWVARKYVAVITPKIYLSAETEIWPNIFVALQKKNVPIVIVNGRISDKAFSGYRKVKLLLKGILSCVSAFCMQTSRDAEKIKMLGALPERIHTTGNVKFDDLPATGDLKPADLKIQNSDIVIVAGSTHPGEEEIVLQSYRSLLEEFKNLRLIIAPRHIERSDEVAGLVVREGFFALKFSQAKNPSSHQAAKPSVIVVDTIGHLKSLYALAAIVFVGKSLTVSGGQNMIEPAFFAKPIIVGPHTENFKDVVEVFLKEKALIEVPDAEALTGAMRELLRRPEVRLAYGRLAKKVVEENTGATRRTMQTVNDLLAGKT